MNMDGISIIVPFLNESECIDNFCNVMDAYAKSRKFPIELIFVDDGSSDDGGKILRGHKFSIIKSIQLITLSRNFGSHSAIRAGVSRAQYQICTWMGCDLQEPLEFLNEAYERLIGGDFDAVYIEKESVDVSFLNRSFSKIYSHLMRKYAVANYRSGGISTIVFNRKIIEYLNANTENNSSIMLQIINAGFKNCTIALNYGKRYAGKSKWTLKKKIKLFIDSFVSFSTMPIHLVTVAGIILFSIGLFWIIGIIVGKCINPSIEIEYNVIEALLILGFGLNNISLAILAEYIWRGYDAARARPPYIIESADVLVSGNGKKDD